MVIIYTLLKMFIIQQFVTNNFFNENEVLYIIEAKGTKNILEELKKEKRIFRNKFKYGYTNPNFNMYIYIY